MKMIGQGPFKKYVRKKVFLIKLLISESLQKSKIFQFRCAQVLRKKKNSQ